MDTRWILTNYMPYYENVKKINGVPVAVCRFCFKPISETKGSKTRKFCNPTCKHNYWVKWSWGLASGRVFRRDHSSCRDCGENSTHIDYETHHILPVEWMPYIVGAAMRPSCERLTQPLRDYIEKNREILYPSAPVWGSKLLKENPPPSHLEILNTLMARAAVNYLGEKDRYTLALKTAMLDEINLITLCKKCHDKPHVHNMPSIPQRPFHDYRYHPLLGLVGLAAPREVNLERQVWGGLVRDPQKQWYHVKWDYVNHKKISEIWHNDMEAPSVGRWGMFAKLAYKQGHSNQKGLDAFLVR